MTESETKQRIAKFIAHSGYCSRRDAERLIEDGRVKVNKVVIKTPVFFVSPEDEVIVEGKVISASTEKKRIFIFNKPTGVVCTRSDEKGRKTIYDFLPADFQNLHYIGRLDINSEGLLMLTNSSEVKRFYEHPENKIARVYRVRTYGEVTSRMLSQAPKGIAIFDEKQGKKITYHAQIEIESKQNEGRNQWLQITLREGKNREIRRICEHYGLEVSRLIRTEFGEFKLKNLARGELREV